MQPKIIFGEGTAELEAFYKAVKIVAPGPWELLQDLLASWQPMALSHDWKLPDGYDARVKVMEKVEKRIEVDELDHATFAYEYYDNIGTPKGLSIAANVVHSIDAYVLRSMHRRCNYDPIMVPAARYLINKILGYRKDLGALPSVQVPTGKTKYYIEQYQRSNMADVVFLPYLTPSNIDQLSTAHLEKLSTLIDQMQMYEPFPLITIHDEFKCHPNNMNHLRQQYIYIMADLAESDTLSDVLTQIHGHTGKWMKKSRDLGVKIREGNYALS